VVDRLQQLKDELGLDGILGELNPGDLIPLDRVMMARLPRQHFRTP
jgi:hypothetical protein